MSARFVVFTKTSEADYIIDGYGFKCVELTPEEVTKVMRTVTQYYVAKYETEHYSHDDMGDYDYTELVATYELDQIKSISEKIWLENEKACDIIINDGNFVGVVFFTGFTDYRGEEQYGFIPLEYVHDRKDLSKWCSTDISIILQEGITFSQAGYHINEQTTGRTSRSWDVNYKLLKK